MSVCFGARRVRAASRRAIRCPRVRGPRLDTRRARGRGVRQLDGGIVTLTALNAMTHLQLGSVPGRSSSEVLL